VRVVSVASVWFFDVAERRYLRMPLAEAPRVLPDLDPRTDGACDDLVWHDYADWWVTDDRMRLVVCPTGLEPFWASLVEGLPTLYLLDAEVARRSFDLRRSERPADSHCP
jgi:hypothetical protein